MQTPDTRLTPMERLESRVWYIVSSFDCADFGRSRSRFPTRFVVNLPEVTLVHAIGEEFVVIESNQGADFAANSCLYPADLRALASAPGAKMHQLFPERCDGARNLSARKTPGRVTVRCVPSSSQTATCPPI
jgi:hypothetical protein